MRIFFLVILLILSTISFAETLQFKLQSNKVIYTEAPPEIYSKYAFSNMPFPLDKYLVSTFVANPDFRGEDRSDTATLYNTKNIKLTGILELITYDKTTNIYKYRLILDQKISLIKIDMNKPLSKFPKKVIPARLTFAANRESSIILSDEFLQQKKLDEDFTNQGKDIVRLSSDHLKSVSATTTKEILINAEVKRHE